MSFQVIIGEVQLNQDIVLIFLTMSFPVIIGEVQLNQDIVLICLITHDSSNYDQISSTNFEF